MKGYDHRLLKLELQELEQLQRQLEAGGNWQAAALRRKLTEAGLTTEIWFHDHNFNLFRRVDWMPNLACFFL